MSRTLLLLLPALVLPAQDSGIPGAVEVRSGIFVLRGAPNEATCLAIKKQHITHVVDLRRDDEADADCQGESSRLHDLGVAYQRYALAKAPPPDDFDFLRQILRELPKGSRVLIHCSNGNRAAAVVCPWLVLDKGLSLEEALRIAREAGLRLPETEEAVRRYLGSRVKKA
jgi:protein tyrosine phosphatase (PTP) superfamily phosphohydrolase (DUF442 family)